VLWRSREKRPSASSYPSVLRPVCPPCISTKTTRRIFVKFDIDGIFMKIRSKISNMVKIWKIKNTLHEDLITFDCTRRHKFVVKALIVTLFYIADIDMSLNNTHLKHFCVSIGTMVKRTRHNVKKYVVLLSCYRYIHSSCKDAFTSGDCLTLWRQNFFFNISTPCM
jgi:hypothetical protein